MRLHPVGPLLQPLLRLKPPFKPGKPPFRLNHPLNTTTITTTTITTTATTTTTRITTKPKMTTPPTLPALPEVTRLAPGLIRILASNPGKFTLQGTNTYLLGTGPSRLLIDTGEGRATWLATLQRVLHDEQANVAVVVLTHWHPDHTGGVAGVVAAWPGVRVLKYDAGEGEDRGEEGWEGLRDGQVLRVEKGVTVRAVHTPGHTADHVVLWWEERGELFTGDNVLGHGTSVFEDLGAYVDSLERMRRLYGEGTATATAYPGHGAVVVDGPGKIAEYIRHRGQREEQVVQTLRSAGSGNGAAGTVVVKEGSGNGTDAWTVMELVRSIYRDVPESLHPAAAGGVVQILEKLKREGRVVEVDDGERWRLSSASGRSAL